VRSGRCIHTLSGHRGEVSSTQFNYAGNLCVSGSIDRTCRLWDVGSGRCISVRQVGRPLPRPAQRMQKLRIETKGISGGRFRS
jgi:WD40 repeat protein